MKLNALRTGTGEEFSAPCEPECNCLACSVRSLLRHASVRDSSVEDGQEILLDTCVDGSRYLLVRVPPAADPVAPLSPREQEIVRMVSRGFPNKVIADVLSISPWTVGTHLRRIFAKLGVTSRAAMVARVRDSARDRAEHSDFSSLSKKHGAS
jgi:DNA-binding CsgD family transcriptional regulator